MNNNQIERESYSRSSYRMVQSTRARGAEYGLDVPTCIILYRPNVALVSVWRSC